jgi:tetratricopeptide (TPR) repeat protein
MRTRSLCLTFVLALVLAPIGAVAAGAQVRGGAELDAWRVDLQALASELPRRHRNLFHTVSRDAFDAAVRRLDERLPSLSRHEVIVELARIVAMVEDGHTSLAGFPFAGIYGFHHYPIGMYAFKDGVYVYAADPAYREAVGGRVVSFGNAPISEAMRAVEGLVFHDNAMGVRLYAPYLLTVPEIAHAVRLVTDMDQARLVVEKDGRQVTVTLRAAPRPALHGPPAGFFRLPDWVDARDLTSPPRWLKNAGDPFWFEYVEDARTLYVQFNAVANKEDETVEAFARRLFASAEAKRADRIVFDLRWNGGGNNGLNRPLLLGLLKSRFDEPGRVFVLTSRHTFSAAQNFVNVFDRFTNASFVGEPTGQRPNHYGDARPFTLPNSKLAVNASTLWWQDMDPRDTRRWTPPDLAVELTFEDYRTGADPALQMAMTYVPRSPLAVRMLEAYDAGDQALAARLFHQFRADPVNRYADVEADVNRLGYSLLNANRIDAAIAAFTLNVEAHPDSSNVYDSLGEAYLKAGKRDLAIKNYARSVELNPGNVEGARILETLRKGGPQ